MSDPYNRDADLAEFGALNDPADPAWVVEAAHKAADLGGEDDASEDIELPPDRVRFSAPLVVEAPDVDEPCDGVIVNLSATGLACVLPLPLHPGERVACKFRPALGEPHIELEADVVWRRRAGGEDSLYGLCFADVPEAAAERLDDLVRERSEGRAGEWPLPVAPAAEPAVPAKRRGNAYVAATLGVAAGAVLSLGLSILPDMLLGGATSRPLLPSRALASSADPATLRTPAPETTPEAVRSFTAGSVTPAAARPMVAPVAPAIRAPEAPAASPAVADSAKPAPAKPAAPSAVAALDFSGTKASLDFEPDASRAEPKAAETKSGQLKSAGPKTGESKAAEAKTTESKTTESRTAKASHPTHTMSAHKTQVTQNAHEGEVTLRLDRSAATLKSFWLDDPRRLVVDVPGAHSMVDAGEQTLAGPLATRLRIGEHSDKVRFVIETAPGVTADVKLASSALVIKLLKH